MTKLSSTLPGGDNNGLGALAGALTTDPKKTAIIVAVVDCKSITIDTDTGDRVATVRIRRVEPIDPQDTAQAQRLLVRGLERRTGAVMLPIDLEDELDKLFANLVESVDLETGEIILEDDEAEAVPSVDEVEDAPAEAAAWNIVDGTTAEVVYLGPVEDAPAEAAAEEPVVDESMIESMLAEAVPVVEQVQRDPDPEAVKKPRKSRAKKTEPEPVETVPESPATADDGAAWPEP